MELATARDLARKGVIYAALIRGPAPGGEGYCVEFRMHSGGEPVGPYGEPLAGDMMRTARGDVRLFKTLDAAAKVVRSLGLHSISVYLP